MNTAVEIRKTPDGTIQARRSDGKPLTEDDRAEARRLAIIEELPPQARVVKQIYEGETLRAIMIYSEILNDHLWVKARGIRFALCRPEEPEARG